MKKFMIIGAIVLTMVSILAVGVGFAYAQTRTPLAPGSGYGPGMMGNGWHGGGMMGWRSDGGYGSMHQYMIAALAEALDMTPEDLQARIDKGETPYDIAKEKGLTDEQIRDLFEQAHDKALDKAVEAGMITQEQADWMDQHHEQMWENGFGSSSGNCPMGGSARRGAGGTLEQPAIGP